MSILIENVSKKFNGKTVLDSINLEIKTGSLVALLGGSGSGKSSLLRVVAGFEQPDTGRVWLHGKNSRQISVQEKEIGFVFQAYALFQHLTVYENIAFGVSINKKNLINNPKNSISFSFVEREPLSSHSNEKLVLKPRSNFVFNDFSQLISMTNIVLHSVTNLVHIQKQVIKALIAFIGGRALKKSALDNSLNKVPFNPSKYSTQEVVLKKTENVWQGSSPLGGKQRKDISSFSSLTSEVNEITKGQFNKLGHSVEELLKVVGLEELAHRYPAQLSGGQCQRVALARALAVEPKVLLLDEPFGALDQKVRKQLRRWLRQLHEKVGVTTIFVTHDYQEAMEVANEIVVLEKGRVKYSLQQPKSFYKKINQQ